METQTSKTGVNILIVLAILLIGGSLFVTSTKPATVPLVATTTPIEKTIVATTTALEVATSTEEASTAPLVIATTSEVTASSTASFIGKKWTWVKTTPQGMGVKDITPKKVTVFTITLTATGTISGTTDCNTFFGSYKTDTTKLSFGPLASTKMFCEGAQEGVFLSGLQDVKGYMIDVNKNLVLMSGSSTLYFK